MSSYGTDTLATIQNGKVPATRMSSADQVQNWVRRLVDADNKRSFKRSRVEGQVGGNPPYRMSKLKEAGRSDACNVNFGIARSYMESGVGAFYDLFSEAPGFVTISTSHGDDDHRDEYSRIMSAEADRILGNDRVWDYNMQRSQDQMVLHGCGPLMFEDVFCILPRAVNTGDLKVPEFTKSDTHYWEAGMVQIDYYPPELYEFIKDEVAATAAGWDVEYTKNVIQNAMDVKTQPGIRQEWEFYQQELKNNSLAYLDDSKVNRLAHVFWKEFDGKITQVIVERDTTVSTPTNKNPADMDPGVKFLFRHVGRYNCWEEALHPMYFDRGNGGYHHSVTGLGVKMYGAMEYQNRLLCNLSDKAFSPKTLFKPTSTEASQRFQLAHHGDYGLLPPGYDAIQNPIAGMLDEGLAWNGALTEIMRGNLAQYKSGGMPMKQTGNPITRAQVMYDAQQNATMSKTTYNRYYKQLDALYTEIVRRMCNLNTTDKRALEFQERCTKQGVPRECFGRIEKVAAVRVIGQGSTFMRKQAVDSLAQVVGSLPEEGRNNWLCDKIAIEAGQSAVSRYNPQKSTKPKMANDQQAEAALQIAAMKVGVPPVVTQSQNPLTFAAAFLSAGVQAVQSVQQGGNPLDVLKFMQICGPSIAAHLKRFAHDPFRQGAWKQLVQQWQQLSKVTDLLKKKVQQQMQQQNGQNGKTSMAMTDEQIKTAKAKNDMSIKAQKAKLDMQIKAQKHRLSAAKSIQDMKLADASTAADIHRNRMRAFEE